MIDIAISVLLIEDNKADAALIERQIRKILSLPQIVHVSKLEEAMRLIQTLKPDIILCDYQLRGFTGLEVLKYVMSLPNRIPFVFITGTINDEELAANTILAGATGYILKKHINILHEKLLPHFKNIINLREEMIISGEHQRVIDEIQKYMEDVRFRNKIIKADFMEMKKALEKVKAFKDSID